uniref:Aminopeptidase N n=1 Tax=Roseihalotalea indica TaxID=2867963 RepID=A0AA49GQ56_9BACT|nr:M1 family metallopeptidase [Tunicatimonas sp. TK19036]
MIHKIISLTFFVVYILNQYTFAQQSLPQLDVLSYQVQLEPDISQRSIKGRVTVDFLAAEDENQITLDCGSLTVIQVEGKGIKSFRQEKSQVIITFSQPLTEEHSIQIYYHGSPTRGVVFSSEKSQMYTVYFTSEWMVCHDQPDDRASIQLELILPEDLQNVANGILIDEKKVKENKVSYVWQQEVATPPYTYGFALGTFHQASADYKGTDLHYYSDRYPADQLATIFQASPDILRFFEEKAGAPYGQPSYSQLLMGNHYQEMSGFSVLKEAYGDMVLADSTEINLITHELAHQWWGNMITCQNFGHFWLNEAFATYMSAAYNEHRFGQEKYLENINAYREVYETIKAKGADKPLVFKNWLAPTADDRNLVYFKGAYVLHQLRETLGNDTFWKGIRYYSQQYYGKSVLTPEFQRAMEESTGKNLTGFFEKWVYSGN